MLKMSTIDIKPLFIESISSFIRFYVASKHRGAAAIMPVENNMLHVTVMFGMSGCDFTIDLDEYFNDYELNSIFRVLAKEIEQNIG